MTWYNELADELATLISEDGTHYGDPNTQTIQLLIDDLKTGKCEKDATAHRLAGLNLGWFAARLDNYVFHERETQERVSNDKESK